MCRVRRVLAVTQGSGEESWPRLATRSREGERAAHCSVRQKVFIGGVTGSFLPSTMSSHIQFTLLDNANLYWSF